MHKFQSNLATYQKIDNDENFIFRGNRFRLLAWIEYPKTGKVHTGTYSPKIGFCDLRTISAQR
jgi:hypothetical protein